MNETIKTILARRSCRNFTSEPVDEETVRLLLDCALAAPTGMGKQSWQFTAVTNKRKIQKLASAVGEILQNTGYNMYKPPLIIIASNLKTSKFKHFDTACALENIFIACQSLNLGCVWLNQLMDIDDKPDIRKILTEFGIPEDHGVYGIAAIGHKALEAPVKKITGKSLIIN